jgi:PAS domain S-box-containing protein
MDITPRKRAEAALRIREEWLRLSLRAANIGLWDWDVITNQVAYSPEWKSQLGYAAEEIGSAFAKWESRVHPDDLAPTLERVRRALAAGETAYEVEFRMRHKDGAWRWIYTRAEIFRDDRGQAVRVIGCHVDITERKRAEQRLAAFAALGRRLNTATDDTAAARIIADAADELFGWDSCKVDFYDAQTDRSRSILTVDLVNGRRQEFSPALSDTEPSPRLRQVVTTGALLILRPEPVTLSPDSTPFGDKSRPSASIMAVPIREVGKVVGVLAIQSYRLNAYTSDDLAALQDLADHCAGALERIRSRTDLERQRNELALILDTVPGIIFYKDRNHRLVRVNEAHARSLGLPRSAVEGRTDSELGSPYEERYLRDDEEVMRTGQPKLGIIEPLHTPAGGTRWLQTDKLPYRDADGNIIGILGFALDITERKQAEERYRSIFEHAVEGIYRSTPAGRYLTVNPAMAGIYGYASPTAMVQEVTDIGRQIYADPEDLRKLQALLHAQGGLGVFECQMRRRDGSLIWIRQSARAVRDASGQVICYEGSVEDITERREAEEVLRRQHALVTAVVEGTSDAVFAKNLEGRYLIINAAGARALGRPAAEILGHTDAELVPEATARRFREADAAVIASGQAQTQEETGMMAGVRRAWHAAKSPLRDAEGRIVGIIGVSRDITEQKQAEAERARLWSVLEASLNEVYVFDAQSLRFEYVNAAALRNLGYSAGAMRTLTPLDLKPAFTAATFAELVQPLRRHEREEVVFQTEHHRADGSRYPVEVHLQLVDNGGPPVFLAIINDLTERKQAEAELVQLSGRLLRAQDVERRRLAREIHDSTAQTFAALAMNLAVLDRSAAGLDEAGRALLGECETLVRRGTAELRTLAYLLHPPALEALGLTRAIHDYAEGFARRSGVRVELDVAEPPDRLPPELELTLFRVLQESLGNLHRHSGSATAAIRLAQDAETVVIEVRDTGCGLGLTGLAAATSGSACFGVGIAGMRERLRLLGGRLEIEAALPGVRVRATLPLSTTADE